VKADAFVLDTSALMALIEDEAGASRVEDILRTGKAILPFPVLLEVYYVTLRERGEEEADRRYAILRQSGAEIIWQMDEPTLLIAARLKAFNRVSLADATIAACAVRIGATLLHKDPEYDALVGEIRLEALPYK
jgi:predicted nucleic acid-binding protein